MIGKRKIVLIMNNPWIRELMYFPRKMCVEERFESKSRFNVSDFFSSTKFLIVSTGVKNINRKLTAENVGDKTLSIIFLFVTSLRDIKLPKKRPPLIKEKIARKI